MGIRTTGKNTGNHIAESITSSFYFHHSRFLSFTTSLLKHFISLHSHLLPLKIHRIFCAHISSSATYKKSFTTGSYQYFIRWFLQDIIFFVCSAEFKLNIMELFYWAHIGRMGLYKYFTMWNIQNRHVLFYSDGCLHCELRCVVHGKLC